MCNTEFVDKKGKKKMKVVGYNPKYKEAFIEMNKRWISEMFVMEAEDIRELGNIEPYIEQGGEIFFALDDTDEPIACCLIAPREDGDWEIMKFAAAGMYTGSGAGTACLKACVEYAKEKRIEKVLIVSNRKCTHAINIYRKHGFVEIPVDKEKFPFDRADIAFEQYFSYE